MRRALLTARTTPAMTYTYNIIPGPGASVGTSVPAHSAAVIVGFQATFASASGVTTSTQTAGNFCIVRALNTSSSSGSVWLDSTIQAGLGGAVLNGATSLPTVTNPTERGLAASWTETAAGLLLDYAAVYGGIVTGTPVAPTGETNRADSGLWDTGFWQYRTFLASGASAGGTTFGGWTGISSTYSGRITLVIT